MSQSPQSTVQLQYKISNTWDNRAIGDNAEITIIFKKSDSNDRSFIIAVEAPFYDDPKLPSDTPPGRVDGLWDYEVVEVFFLGSDNKYLEIELGPRGHYLVYYLEVLEGEKKVTKSHLKLENYKAEISQDGERWKGETKMPIEYLPPNVSKFNAYAIHGSDPNRAYMALFPVKQSVHEQPNFHRLEPFREIDLHQILNY